MSWSTAEFKSANTAAGKSVGYNSLKTEQQHCAVIAFVSGRNVFIAFPAGFGKSHCLLQLLAMHLWMLKRHRKPVRSGRCYTVASAYEKTKVQCLQPKDWIPMMRHGTGFMKRSFSYCLFGLNNFWERRSGDWCSPCEVVVRIFGEVSINVYWLCVHSALFEMVYYCSNVYVQFVIWVMTSTRNSITLKFVKIEVLSPLNVNILAHTATVVAQEFNYWCNPYMTYKTTA